MMPDRPLTYPSSAGGYTLKTYPIFRVPHRSALSEHQRVLALPLPDHHLEWASWHLPTSHLGGERLIFQGSIFLPEIEPKLHDWFVRFEAQRREEEKLA